MTTYYHIRVKGHLDPVWSDWFENLTIIHTADGETTLAGPVNDQAALYGLIIKARDLGLTLIAVTPVDPGTHTSEQNGGHTIADLHQVTKPAE